MHPETDTSAALIAEDWQLVTLRRPASPPPAAARACRMHPEEASGLCNMLFACLVALMGR